ncbi:oligosaccharide flippase family protein [Selenomonas sp. WCA-380-WT-3B 3/]|uniref:Oligosaccharide flippase family protein n=1 Tax=Selenomonas montiformis TaxID=2652285 RepID=A0A6I2UUS5_9FIRM|nr:oligosaccharide flippase family protein [Selenomonas montiformis]MSV24957.1 oligosaccharide flippase family protein [Selenomonas montiformis]
MSDIGNKVRSSTKWTLLTEVLAKAITPITGMILARLLSPEAFGVVAAILVVTSFAEIFADAGFQKYFIQHEFYEEAEKRSCFITAVITSCSIAAVIWLVIFIFAGPIATMMGIPKAVWGIRLAGIGIIVNSYNGMQAAIFKRNFQFKLLFKVKMIVLLVPLLVTIPLAYAGCGYWALIIGTLSQQVLTCLIQSYYTAMPLGWLFCIEDLRKMLSFSLWTLFESITIWFSTWGGMFLVGMMLSSYYLGIYRGVMTLVGAAFSIVTGTIMPVLFTALSRLQNDMNAFREIVISIQYKLALILLPLGAILYIFQDLIIGFLLGNQWQEGDFFFGIWSLTMCLSILINGFASEALRARGMPRMSSLSQLLHFPVLFVLIWYTAKISFQALAIGTCLSSLWLYTVKLIMLRQVLGFSLRKIFGCILNAALPAAIAGFLAWKIRMLLSGHHEPLSIIVAFLIFFLCYMSLILIGKNNRKLVFDGFNFLRSKFYR